MWETGRCVGPVDTWSLVLCLHRVGDPDGTLGVREEKGPLTKDRTVRSLRGRSHFFFSVPKFKKIFYSETQFYETFTFFSISGKKSMDPPEPA